MLATLRALRKDLFELQKTGRGLMLAFVAPALVVVLVGQLNVRPPAFRVLIAGTSSETESKALNRLKTLLGELAGVTIDSESEKPAEPLEAVRRGSYDLVLLPNELGDKMVVYSAATEPARVAQIRELATRVEWTLAVSMDRIETEEREAKQNGAEELRGSKTNEAAPTKAQSSQRKELSELYAAGIIPPESLHLYYPRARDRSAAFLPMTIALVLCFFPFIIASTALVREKESHTIEVLLTVPGMTHSRLFAAKCCLPILVAAFDAVLMFICAESFYQYYFKDDFLLFAVFLFLATTAVTFLGLAVSAIVRSTIQAAAASALYFVCLLLFSGFFVPLDQSSSIVRSIANFLPLATLDEVIKAWMFGAGLPHPSALPLTLLLGQTVLFGATAWLCFRRVFVNRL